LEKGQRDSTLKAEEDKKEAARRRMDFKDGWLRIWLPQEKRPEFSNLRYPNDPMKKYYRDGTEKVVDFQFQRPVGLGYNLCKFDIHVSETEGFVSNFPPVSASWEKGNTLNEKVWYSIRKVPIDY
jgi:hypothetical protein